MNNELLTVRQASKKLGVSASKIRYYCNHGLVPFVKRSRAGYRMFEGWQVDWLRTLIELRDSGLEITTLRKYAKLCRQGDMTIAERKAILTTRKHQILQEIEELNSHLGFLEQHEELCDAVLKGEQVTDSQWF